MVIRPGPNLKTHRIRYVQVISGQLPIDLLAKERAAIYASAEEGDRLVWWDENRDRTLNLQQQIWDQENRGRWTDKLIKDIHLWVDRRHRELVYYLTRFLSGHGYYREYLHRIGKHPIHERLYANNSDDAEHTFYLCAKSASKRQSYG